MVIEEKLRELKEQINKIVPGGITISDVEFEALSSSSTLMTQNSLPTRRT